MPAPGAVVKAWRFPGSDGEETPGTGPNDVEISTDPFKRASLFLFHCSLLFFIPQGKMHVNVRYCSRMVRLCRKWVAQGVNAILRNPREKAALSDLGHCHA